MLLQSGERKGDECQRNKGGDADDEVESFHGRGPLKHPRNQRPDEPDGGKDTRDKKGGDDQEAEKLHQKVKGLHLDAS